MTASTTTRATIKSNAIKVRLVHDAAEIEESQSLRYKVFYEEYGAVPTEEMKRLERDFDQYDAHSDHLVVTDVIDGQDVIVGTYRLLQQGGADKCGQFYSSEEYDLTKILNSGLKLLELGRSCVLPQYRARPVLQLLWQGIADYIAQENIDMMFGCASLHNTDIGALAPALSYMHHYHRAPDDLCPRAVEGRYIGMNILEKDTLDIKSTFSDLPPLIKGYLRVGALIGDGAVIDPQFNTTDVCIVAQTNFVTQRYKKHYERKIEREFGTGESAPSDNDNETDSDNA